MELGLHHLIEKKLSSHIEENRQFYAQRNAAIKNSHPPDLKNVDVLQELRNLGSKSTLPGRAAFTTARVGKKQVPLRIITPQKADIQGVCLDIHGGGFYMDSAAKNDLRNASLSDALGVAVISVDYRLAPEFPWPAAPDDCETAALWIMENSERMFGNNNLIIRGASAGSNLAMTTLLRLRDLQKIDCVKGSVLEFGAYDLSGRTPGGRLYNHEYFIDLYVGQVGDRGDPDISPLFGSLSGLPPTLLIVGTLDILLEDNLAMAARLSVAGNDVDIRVYPESPHGFTFHPTSMAKAATWDITTWIRDRLAKSDF